MDEKTNGTVVKYTNCDIPAKLFFEILNTRNFNILGEGDENELQEAFGIIFDEYTELDNNQKIKYWYSRARQSQLIVAQINQITNITYMLAYLELTEPQRSELVKELNSVHGVKVNFDVNKDLLSEIERIQQSVLGQLRNKLRDLEGVQEENTEKVIHIFQRDIAKISTILGFQISTDITMYEYITYKHAVTESIKQRNAKK